MFGEIVTLRTRTGKDEQFMSDGRIYTIDSKKGLKVPRFAATLAYDQNALHWSKTSGGVIDSKVYVEDDIPEGQEAPGKITEEEIRAVKKTSGIGKGKIRVNGKEVAMTSIDLDPADD